MLNFYQPTMLEEWIELKYKNHNFLVPTDLNIDKIASLFNIEVIYLPDAKEESIWDEETAVIFLNSKKTDLQIREVFFHELCHPLRHYGNQLMMPETLRELQEIQAKSFQLYAAIPFFMVKKMSMPEYEKDIPHLLASEFNVTTKLAKYRWEQIKRRISRVRWDRACIEHERSIQRKSFWFRENPGVLLNEI